jgi:preprotein translocase subunit SecF
MINFIKKRRLWYSISMACIGLGLVFMVKNYNAMQHVFNMGIDFTGGTSIILRFEQPVENIEQALRPILNEQELSKHTLQRSGQFDIIIKTQEMDITKRNALFSSITKSIGAFDILEVDVIGPSIGEELKSKSFLIIIAVAIAILIYCSWRFELTFGLASIIALLHDTLIILSMTAIFKFELNTAYVAALLTVLGYSINDTIVIFDRIREKVLQNKDSEDSLSKSLLNTAVNEMVPRSIHTSITTGVVVLSIFIFGGISLQGFAAVLIVGLVTGTYSSLFIASPMVITLSKLRGVQIEQ